MRWVVLILILFFICCGGGGGDTTSTDTSDDQSDIDTSNFDGTYTFKQSDCSYSLFVSFSIVQSNADLVLIVSAPGSSGSESGDLFVGSAVEGTNTTIADFFDELECQGVLIGTEQTRDNFEAVFGLDVEVGDGFLTCSDSNAESGTCGLVYSFERD